MAGQSEMAAAALASELSKAVKVVEEQVDEELRKLDQMDDDEIEKIRLKRMREMKIAREQRERWQACGHGEYTELADEREFFDACKRSKRVVCHFGDESERSKVLDKHLRQLAGRHVETRFIKVQADRVPFLVDRLNIRVKPTLALVIDGKTEHYIRGTDARLGGADANADLPAGALQSLLGAYDVINFRPPQPHKHNTTVTTLGKGAKPNLRSNDDSDSDEDY